MLDIFMIFTAKYVYLFIVLIAISFFIKEKTLQKNILISSAFILPLVFIVSKIASMFYYDVRPFVAEHFTPLISHAANNGFPSDHSLISFAFASIVFLFNRKLGFVLFSLSFLVGISRVYVGVHYPIDILGSFVISVIVSVICVKIISWKK